jgi:Cytochrome C oxidase, cbb3-type, subunit III
MSRFSARFAGSLLIAAAVVIATLARADDTPPAAAPASAPTAAPTAASAAAPASTAATAPAAAPAAAAPAAPADAGAPLYKVVDGNHVDHNTMQGWRTWRALACERCHGANQEGLVGPSLVTDLKTMSREDFNKCVLDGRIDKGMPNFGTTKSVVDNIDGLYAFLKGRSDGAIPTGHLQEIQ